jgi:pimeloyl-ACP methyl ester carboxylesterase
VLPQPAERGDLLAGESIPITNAASERFARKTAELAGRCGEVSGWLLPHISTADTARDLDHLRGLLGEEELTYVGLSYGTLIGQTYANLFPDRVRAMLLMGLIDAPEDTAGAEARSASDVSSTDEVFDQFLALCDGAGPERCALAGGGQTAFERVEQLFAQVRRAPIPAPGATPPLSSPEELSYGDLLISQFQPLRVPSTWPANAAALAAALGGRRIRARERGKLLQLGCRLGRHDDLGGDLLRRRPGRQGRAGLAAGHRTTRADQPAPGPRPGLVAVGPLRLLAGARRGQLPRAMGRLDPEPDPAHQPAL